MRLLLLLLLSTSQMFAQNQYPEISNLSVQVINSEVTLTYDILDPEGESMDVKFMVSNDGGKSYAIDTQNATGDVGTSISSGSNKTITWNGSGLLTGDGDYQVKLVADDGFQFDIQEIVDQVDSTRIRENLEFIEGIRHRTTNPTHLENVKDTIEQRFAEAGLNAFRIDFDENGYTAQNVVGHLEGTTASENAYIIDGHFDTVDDSPGADDNGSAVAGMLEAMRVLAPYRFRKSLEFIGFDLEEDGLLGAFDYTANSIPSYKTIDGVFNLEMIGYYTEEPNTQQFPTGFEILYPDVQATLEADQFRGNFITNIADQNSIALMEAYDNAAAQYVPELKTISIVAPEQWLVLTPDFGRSDHAPFWLSGIPALMLTDGSEFRNPFYHSPNDLIETLNFTFMTNVVKAVVGAVAEEAGIQHSTTATTDFSIMTNTSDELNCDFSISPIPAQDNLIIRFNNCFANNLILKLYDLSGKVLLENNIDPKQINTQLDIRSLQAGLYILKISSDQGYLSQKILIE